MEKQFEQNDKSTKTDRSYCTADKRPKASNEMTFASSIYSYINLAGGCNDMSFLSLEGCFKEKAYYTTGTDSSRSKSSFSALFWNVLKPSTVPLFFDVSFPRVRWSFVKQIMMHNCLPFLSIRVANNGVLIRAS